ncbi:MAG: hypothetical protein US86_C0002G0100 [Candidatus Daviesbacteria bacterium GW2011_GWA2_38_24]|uniref:GerMN domain-containing protein n=1 Tax=Candidatus Daviesbacteria bacterium GW2011_GWA2_38_24 TaxID=1618422 RepID=A0A0G0JH30_9BACT|nr:MAG: hypothetical protein US86_C0002G0100 [Candidatus Daviesbacteria bacterium GW2011_GWA2_38_24]KKQ80743.1 MAG: hypothetical protein UT01_C0006G0004 [Candidatus Daviesbacteria bacterium GW2011_GWA1_38_7]OGE22945.1 MAG: hypothetical protein A2688_03830 [Candidatus Daviesbacteria bacterium RIFCSPHIGHO2_01_FULL_38_8]
MKKVLILVLLIIFISGSGWLWYKNSRQTPPISVNNTGNELDKRDLIRVEEPRPNAVVTNPLSIKGEARGNWFFEADFPVRLVDENGNELGRAIATANGDWMTENFVPFASELIFTAQAPGRGTLILEKNNPSGLKEQADELRIPVNFEETKTRSIQLFYYNSQRDPSESCSPEAVLPVTRNIPLTQTPIQDAIKLLLRGELTEEERAKGFTSEFSLTGVELKGANLENGILTLEFVDPQGKLSRGSCRVRLLWAQIEKTALQFPEVKEVRFIPEELFQP